MVYFLFLAKQSKLHSLLISQFICDVFWFALLFLCRSSCLTLLFVLCTAFWPVVEVGKGLSVLWVSVYWVVGYHNLPCIPLMYGFAIDNWWRWIGSYFVFDVISRKWSIRALGTDCRLDTETVSRSLPPSFHCFFFIIIFFFFSNCFCFSFLLYVSDRVFDHHWEDYVRSSLWFVLIDDEWRTVHSLALSLLLPLYLPFLYTPEPVFFLSVWIVSMPLSNFYGLGKYWQSLKRKLLFQGWATYNNRHNSRQNIVSQDFLDHQI